MENYKITFVMELDDNILKRMEEEYQIPTRKECYYIEANNPNQAMRLFRKKYKMKAIPIRTSNLLKEVYFVRTQDNKKSYMYRLLGMSWNKEFTYLNKRWS